MRTYQKVLQDIEVFETNFHNIEINETNIPIFYSLTPTNEIVGSFFKTLSRFFYT